MKFVISSTAFSARLQAMGRVVTPKNNVSILECFVFDVRDKKLTLTASDNENTLVSVLDLVEQDGDIRFAVNAKTVQDAVKEIPEQPLEVYVNEQTMEVTVEYQNGQYRFMAQGADEFPVPPALDGDITTLSIPTESLLTGVGRELFATADDTLRPVMNGVFFDVKVGNVTFVASDGHKLACSTVNELQAEKEGSFILPKKPASLLKNLFSKESGDVKIQFNARSAVFSTDTATLTCRLIEGHYPNYRSVIPQGNPNEATLNRQALLSVLRRVMIFSNVNSALVKLTFDMGSLSVSGQDIEYSMSADEKMLCDYNGTPMRIGFKGPFLTDLLNNLQSEEVTIRLSDSTRAGVIVPTTQPEGEEVLMLLMPMMLND
ncbi:MAG: DNA polymerase III subunit beta [Bacteroidaceae bacterium]|nr:DNA polymerase III subunit beta [Bacteroidaceae bacterium]